MKPTLVERQTALRIRSAELRAQMALQSRALEAPLATADRLRDGWRWLSRHRQWLWLGGAALALLRPRRTLRLLGRGWLGWRALRRWQPLLAVVIDTLRRSTATGGTPP